MWVAVFQSINRGPEREMGLTIRSQYQVLNRLPAASGEQAREIVRSPPKPVSTEEMQRSNAIGDAGQVKCDGELGQPDALATYGKARDVCDGNEWWLQVCRRCESLDAFV